MIGPMGQFPTVGFYAAGQPHEPSPWCLATMAKVLLSKGKGQQGFAIYGSFVSSSPHIRVEAGGCVEEQRLTRLRGVVRAGRWCFHSQHATIAGLVTQIAI